MRDYLLIGLGGALGSVGRYWLADLVTARWGSAFPWGTMLVNVTGCFAIGFFGTLTGPDGREVPAPLRTFFMVGICGGYTTFSAFAYQTMLLSHEGEWWKASANIAGSVLLCLAGVALGHLAARSILALRQ